MEIQRITDRRFPRYLTLQDAMSLDEWHLLRSGESLIVDETVGDMLIASGSCARTYGETTNEGQEE